MILIQGTERGVVAWDLGSYWVVLVVGGAGNMHLNHCRFSISWQPNFSFLIQS
jgi:hypothetical protein